MAKSVTCIPQTRNIFTAAPITGIAKRKVAGYARVSTDTDEQFTSYEAQVDYYTNYIRSRPDWEYIKVYADEGISAVTTKHRDGFNEMVEDALAGRIDLIVTKSVSRFARNTVDSLTTIRKLKDHGVECYFEKENIWTFDGKGELLITIMSSLAQEESRSISENVTWGYRKRMADGKFALAYSTFLGYDKGPDGNLAVNREQAKVVRLIYRSFMEGMSYAAICRMLEERGIPTPGGKKKWNESTVLSILTNEKYKGDALLQKTFTVDYLTKKHKVNEGEIPQYYVEADHEAIIPPEEFEQVQAEVARRKRIGKSYSGKIFGTRIICGDCGGYYGQKVWHSNDAYRKIVWRCNRKYGKGTKCSTPTLRKRLSLLMITVITAVLLCAAVLVLFLSEQMFNENERARLNIQADQLAQTVKINELLQTSQLAKLEVSNGLIISIWDEGGPIPFHGGWQPASDRDSLISQAMEQASDNTERWDGTIRGEHGERYLATVRRVSNYRFIRTVVMLQDEQSADAQRAGQRWRYAAIAILVFILISYLCWHFTGKMIQPIKEAHEQQNQFVSAASHDLRTPLQVIRVNAEALKLNPPDRDRFIDRILKELTHVSNLSEDLLTLTTAPDDNATQGNPVEISDLVNNAVEYYKAAAAQKEIALSSSLPAEPLPLIEGNEAMLQRALNILIDNAICYTPAGGHIAVDVSLQAKKVTIAVRDDGPGIAPEHQSRIFDRFYRVDKNRTDRAHSGLGLSIAKKVIADHGGELTYITVTPHGSVFIISLPCLHTQNV